MGVASGCISHIATPRLDVYQPQQPNGAAVLVAPGGGYTQISIKGEGIAAARWLNTLGITAFVLTYRLPREGWAAGSLAPLQDAQRALRTIRADAGRFGLDGERIGVLGFSAGGHLLGLASARPDFPSYTAIDAIDDHAPTADFAALIYPVVTLKPPLDRTSSHRQLIGLKAGPALAAEWSVETHIRRTAPPMFLVHAEDDPIISWHNSRILEQACLRSDVPVEFHRFDNGGHGFALGRAGTETVTWPALAAAWMKKRAIVAPEIVSPDIVPPETERVSTL